MPMPRHPLVFCDTETNTLSEHRMPWEIGILIEFPQAVGEWGIHIQDYNHEMEPAAAAVNGFGERFLNDLSYQAMTLSSAVSHLADLLDGAVFVGSNPSFDQTAMRNLFIHGMRTPNWHYRSIDVCTLVSGHLKEYIPGLMTAADRMGINYDKDDLHSALGDARLSRQVYNAVMRA